MKKVHYSCFFLLMPLVLIFEGCGGIPKDALSMNPATLEDRRLQTRLFDTSAEEKILSASAGVLQDLGFNLDESETDLGLIVASKDRDATETGQVILASILAGMGGGPAIYDTKQKIRVSIISSHAGENVERISVRVTFQRIVWDNYGRISRLERLNDPEMYQGFFEKLSKAVFLEAHGI
ncbi:MAG: hypothetical protein FVQ85_12865 [Planctomycetes bacterium]|nr:hypothetical protein [Planctomycetota bacterium]